MVCCLSTYLVSYLSTNVCTNSSTYEPVCLSIYLSFYLPVRPPAHLPVCHACVLYKYCMLAGYQITLLPEKGRVLSWYLSSSKLRKEARVSEYTL